ncbi:MAG: hypothetical protein HYX61_02905 [Gammaproteobacteria bacterium]|nr:hypothetical protein [Gammaproteobacteria bacterium]
MALTKCKECKKEVAKSAKVCPHCGIKAPGSTTVPIITILLGCLIFYIFYSVNSPNKPQKPAQVIAQNATTNQTHSDVSNNEWHRLIMRMSSSERTKLFGQQLNESGIACTPTSTFFQGTGADKTAYWNVACSNGMRYAIAIENDAKGKTTILDCSVLKSVTNVDCFKNLE